MGVWPGPLWPCCAPQLCKGPHNTARTRRAHSDGQGLAGGGGGHYCPGSLCSQLSSSERSGTGCGRWAPAGPWLIPTVVLAPGGRPVNDLLGARLPVEGFPRTRPEKGSDFALSVPMPRPGGHTDEATVLVSADLPSQQQVGATRTGNEGRQLVSPRHVVTREGLGWPTCESPANSAPAR